MSVVRCWLIPLSAITTKDRVSDAIETTNTPGKSEGNPIARPEYSSTTKVTGAIARSSSIAATSCGFSRCCIHWRKKRSTAATSATLAPVNNPTGKSRLTLAPNPVTNAAEITASGMGACQILSARLITARTRNEGGRWEP